MRSVFRGLCVADLVAVAACNGVGPQGCTKEARPAIALAVRESLTGMPVPWPFLAIARDGAYADTARFVYPDSGLVGLAYERVGHYDVTVQAPDYRPWTRTGVAVTGDACHVKTVQLAAWMQKS